ncbi:hypothetical protein JZU71_04875, partial [bacterium]|nr:hypothetical protein [bacterium]
QVDMQMVVPTAKKRRVWLRAFWGFAPEDEGYLGFTLERNRERFLEEYKDGDLVLIYGADEKYTRLEQRQQLLGFLEVEPRRIQDLERSSDNDQKWKRENGFENRWTHALPVKRAWRINRRIRARHMASETFTNHQAILIASRGELLTSAEAQAVLSLPVSPTDVFGEVPLQLDLAGNVANFLNRQPYEVARKAIVKIGIAKDPLDRCNTHNKHLPPACGYKWKVLLKSRTFSSAQEAKAVEDRIKETFPKIFESLGGEFYLVEEGRLQSEFALLAPAKFILKATNKSY